MKKSRREKAMILDIVKEVLDAISAEEMQQLLSWQEICLLMSQKMEGK